MHLVDAGRHFLGSNGIVGAGLGLAMGAALAMKMRSQPAVAVGYFGDGGANTGRVWEFINLAALWKLPLIAVCENNLHAVETHISQAMAGESVAARAGGFGFPAEIVDGQDVLAVHAAVQQARNRALDGQVPSSRRRPIATRDTTSATCRTTGRRAKWPTGSSHVTPSTGSASGWPGRANWTIAASPAATSRATAIVADAIAFAEASPWPDPASVNRAWPDPDPASSAAAVAGRP